MPRLTLPDGSIRDYSASVTGSALAADIGPGLAKAALGIVVDGELRDLSAPIDTDAAVSIVTAKPRDGAVDPNALFLLRHSAAHVMAEAIQRVIPGAQLVYGPPVEQGFYYDMAIPGDRPLSSEDFAAIEAEMAAIVAEDRPFSRFEMAADAGLRKLEGEGSKYKLDNARRAVEAGSPTLSWYATGAPGRDWEDLCRGPHVPSTGRIGAFKVLSLASAYWHGDETSDRLTRVYGTAFPTRQELDQHLARLEEAKRRDHRVIGKALRLYATDERVGPGLILWSPRGAIIRQELQNFISAELRRQGYQQVFTPHIGKLDLYRTSGHYPYYRESQFQPILDHEQLAALSDEGRTCSELSSQLSAGEIEGYLLRPMNCPHHVCIYASEPRSYRDLPVRLAEFGTVYRWEQSGEIGGMTRVRGLTQDDAHLFCREDQVAEELLGCISLVKLIFSTLAIEEYRVRVGLRDPDSSKYVGDPSNWDKAEAACRAAAASLGRPFSEEAGEAAFYGPKIDFVVKDVIGRDWQLGTIQVDYNLPIRFGLEYVGADNARHRPVMIHRAPFGSMERFIGCLIEHFAGAFPAWLAPEQARVLPISEKSNAYAAEVLAALREAGIRATMDESNDRIQSKIRVAAEEKIPYLLVVGPRDAESRSVSLRVRGEMKDHGAVPLAGFVEGLRREIESRGSKKALECQG
ncbi:MAG TPA: threonine--tRNA ligase [Phycisphaerales bacterium]|nr:threonine--tRNA ligase [Phycisphaerales bacterium]HMP36929.1 threonine--tRNA ligase [Phycisphaerales bacterium]